MHFFHENEKWKFKNFLENSIDSGDFNEGIRYGDWFIKKKEGYQIQNWSILKNSEFKLKTNIPSPIDSIKYSDIFVKVLLKKNDYLSIITFVVNNPDRKERKIGLEEIFLESEKDFKEIKCSFSVKRMNEKKGLRSYYLDEYSIKDSLKNQFYYLHFYTRMNSGKLLEIMCKGKDENLDTKILSYKIIMNTFLEDERVYDPFQN